MCGWIRAVLVLWEGFLEGYGLHRVAFLLAPAWGLKWVGLSTYGDPVYEESNTGISALELFFYGFFNGHEAGYRGGA